MPSLKRQMKTHIYMAHKSLFKSQDPGNEICSLALPLEPQWKTEAGKHHHVLQYIDMLRVIKLLEKQIPALSLNVKLQCVSDQSVNELYFKLIKMNINCMLIY